MFSVVIPAHNEERALGRCLSNLLADPVDGEFELVVVCNGCTDGTAAVAAAFGPRVTVIETDVASKVHALNLGDRAVSGFPRCYVDADVSISTAGLRRLVAAVSGPTGVPAAVPTTRFVVEGRPWPVRAFFSVWGRLPFFTEAMASSGVYVLSAAGRERFGAFPDLIADDTYVLSRFGAAERRRVPDAVSEVETPHRLRDIVAVKTRVFVSDRQLASTGVSGTRQHGGRGGFLHVIARRPGLWPAAVVYVGVNLVAEFRARARVRRGDLRWDRDVSSREGVA